MSKIRLFFLWSVAIGLVGCAVRSPMFVLPEKIAFQQKIFERVTHNQLDTMQQALYLPQNSAQNPENWQQGLLLFTEQPAQMTLEQRVTLRQASFAKQAETQAAVRIAQNELKSEVIYPPTERFNNVQLEVTRGKEGHCGYEQMQFADNRSVLAKKSQNLTAYQAELQQLSAQFERLAWQIQCQ